MLSEASANANKIARKELARRLRSADPGLEVVHPNAAGIDIGNASHYVAVRPDRDPEPVRVLHSRSLPFGRVASRLRRQDGRHAINGRLLDSPVRHPGGAWIRGISCECPAYQEPAGPEERCAGEPVAAETSHPRTIEQLVPTPIRYSRAENLLAAACGACNRNGNLHSTYAKGSDTDEHPIGQRHQ